MYTCRYKPMARDARAPPAPPVVAALLIVAALVGVEEAAARRPTAGGAGAGAKDWRHELRRRPRAEVDPATGATSFRKHFVRRDPTTHAETFLSYNTTIPSWLYVDLDEAKHAVESVCFVPSERPGRVRMVIELPRHAVQPLVRALHETTVHESAEGLLHVGRRPCHSVYPDADEDIHLHLNFSAADVSAYGRSVVVEAGEANPDKFLGKTLFTFWTNDTRIGLSDGESSRLRADVTKTDGPKVNLNLNYDPSTGRARRDMTMETPVGTFECKNCYFATNGKFGIDFETTFEGLQGLIFAYVYFDGTIRENFDFKYTAPEGTTGGVSHTSGFSILRNNDTATYFESDKVSTQAELDAYQPWDALSESRLTEGEDKLTMTLSLTESVTMQFGFYMPVFTRFNASYPGAFTVEMGGYERSDGVHAQAYKRNYGIQWDRIQEISCEHPKCAGTWTSTWKGDNKRRNFGVVNMNVTLHQCTAGQTYCLQLDPPGLTCNGEDSGCGGNLQLGDGDCDSDSECAGDLRCGNDNCAQSLGRSGNRWRDPPEWFPDTCCFSSETGPHFTDPSPFYSSSDAQAFKAAIASAASLHLTEVNVDIMSIEAIEMTAPADPADVLDAVIIVQTRIVFLDQDYSTGYAKATALAASLGSGTPTLKSKIDTALTESGRGGHRPKEVSEPVVSTKFASQYTAYDTHDSRDMVSPDGRLHCSCQDWGRSAKGWPFTNEGSLDFGEHCLYVRPALCPAQPLSNPATWASLCM